MPFQIIYGDITKVRADAIVNAANNSLLGGGGVDGAIHRAAGPELLRECRTLNGCETGEAKITGAYRLPARYVIHTVGPVWPGDGSRNALLYGCYRNSLKLAERNGCESVAFPLISAGVYGFPQQTALKIAQQAIRDWLADSDLSVTLVLFDRSVMDAHRKRYSGICGGAKHSASFPCFAQTFSCAVSVPAAPPAPAPRECGVSGKAAAAADYAVPECPSFGSPDPDALRKLLKQQDESFSQALLRLIEERNMKDSECYKAANIDRKLFSKIRSNVAYKPAKPTVLAFAVALRLTLPETEDLMKKAGFAFSGSNVFDIIVKYCISEGIYDIYEINDALFAYDQPLLGGCVNVA